MWFGLVLSPYHRMTFDYYGVLGVTCHQAQWQKPNVPLYLCSQWCITFCVWFCKSLQISADRTSQSSQSIHIYQNPCTQTLKERPTRRLRATLGDSIMIQDSWVEKFNLKVFHTLVNRWRRGVWLQEILHYLVRPMQGISHVRVVVASAGQDRAGVSVWECLVCVYACQNV